MLKASNGQYSSNGLQSCDCIIIDYVAAFASIDRQLTRAVPRITAVASAEQHILTGARYGLRIDLYPCEQVRNEISRLLSRAAGNIQNLKLVTRGLTRRRASSRSRIRMDLSL